MLLFCTRHLLHAIHAAAGSQPEGTDEGGSAAGGTPLIADADDEDEDLSPQRKLVYVCCALLLTLLAGLMSGLTLGLMSLDTVELEVMRISGTPSQKRCAAVIIPLVNNHNFLLVTLLLCNAAATETLPLFIDRLADPFTAVIVSVTVVLTFGEILPQAVCGKYGLEVGASCAWLVRLLMVLSAPVSWPVGKLLDFILGSHHAEMFRRSQLMALVDLHGSMSGFGGSLTEAEVLVIKGALDLTAKTASKSMTPLDKVFMLSTEDRLDERTIEAILISGHSRIPVYKDRNRSHIVGLIMIKEMVLVDPADHLPVSSLNIRELPQLPADTPMYDMLKVFESGKSHMALLTAPRGSSSISSASSENPSLRDGRGWGREAKSRSRAVSEQGTPPQHNRGALSAALDSLVSALNTFFTARTHHRVPQDEETGLFISRQSSSLTFGGGGLGELSNWEDFHEPVGIITIEDVIEELLQQEIIDETDQYIDNMQTSHVDGLLVAQGLPPRLQRYLNTNMFAPRLTLLGAKQRMTAAPLKDVHSTINRIANEDPSRRQAGSASADQTVAMTSCSSSRTRPSSRTTSPTRSRFTSPTRARIPYHHQPPPLPAPHRFTSPTRAHIPSHHQPTHSRFASPTRFPFSSHQPPPPPTQQPQLSHTHPPHATARAPSPANTHSRLESLPSSSHTHHQQPLTNGTHSPPPPLGSMAQPSTATAAQSTSAFSSSFATRTLTQTIAGDARAHGAQDASTHALCSVQPDAPRTLSHPLISLSSSGILGSSGMLGSEVGEHSEPCAQDAVDGQADRHVGEAATHSESCGGNECCEGLGMPGQSHSRTSAGKGQPSRGGDQTPSRVEDSRSSYGSRHSDRGGASRLSPGHRPAPRAHSGVAGGAAEGGGMGAAEGDEDG